MTGEDIWQRRHELDTEIWRAQGMLNNLQALCEQDTGHKLAWCGVGYPARTDVYHCEYCGAQVLKPIERGTHG